MRWYRTLGAVLYVFPLRAAAMTDDIDLKRPDLYINRELSLLEFNGRVLAQALDERLPLLERLRNSGGSFTVQPGGPFS